MAQAERDIVIAGNWKMYKTAEEAVAFVQELMPLVKKAKARIYLAVPFTSIKSVADCVKGSNIVVGAQNMHDASEGAFTGEIAAKMLKEAGAQFVILGHSERRRLFHEDNGFINRKVKRAMQEGLTSILCVGETIQEREAGKTEDILKQQLEECLAGIDAEQAAEIMVAYEPVWAIGTDQVATPEMAEGAQKFCRQKLADMWGKTAAKKTILLYGGSVKLGSAKGLVGQPDIDGLLIGGASLSVDQFSKIVNRID